MTKKKILITGKHSYIGVAVKAWLSVEQGSCSVEAISVKDSSWKMKDFSEFDTVVHVAGIAHSDTRNATADMKTTYYQVNKELTIEVAKKAKKEGVRQFVFMSSMIVYGEAASLGIKKRITEKTAPQPANFYGDSKWQAECGLVALKADDFKVAIIRPPMVYGRGSKGNYPRLAKLAKWIPLFPNVDNERSMIHIDNLCEFIRLIIEHVDDGVFHPQNAHYVKTSDLVMAVATLHGKQLRLTRFFNPLLKLLTKRVGAINKVFGNFSYDMALSEYKMTYQVRDFQESLELTEK
ncbi:MAG: NAD-dependent epimerase/dehydratase family protein [Defluviitaleaceae bacterium]|nr:NAD-dependent epimerase/dehydratase family protein [Defluviitaleaceae bacterium]